MTNIQICGSNQKTDIDAETSFEDGGLLMCDPGVDFDSSRLFRFYKAQSNYIVDSVNYYAFDIVNAPKYSTGEYGLPFFTGYRYYNEDVENLGPSDELVITHASDPNNTRYVETWINFYPTAKYTVVDYTYTDTYDHNDDLYITPKVEPAIDHSLAVPGTLSSEQDELFHKELNSGGPWSAINLNVGDGGVLFDYGSELIFLVTSTMAWLLEYNDGTDEYESAYVFSHTDCTIVYGASACEDKALVYYYDNNLSTQRLAKIEKSGGTWSLQSTSTFTDPESNARYMLNLMNKNDVFYFIVGGVKYGTKVYQYSNLSEVYDTDDSADPDWTGGADSGGQYIISNSQSLSNYRVNDTWPGPITNLTDRHVDFKQVNPDEYAIHDAIGWYWNDQLDSDIIGYTLEYIVDYYVSSIYVISNSTYGYERISSSSGYSYDTITFTLANSVLTHDAEYWVNVTVDTVNGVYALAGLDRRLCYIEDYVFATHKKYAGKFTPVMYPFYAVNEDDGYIRFVKFSAPYNTRTAPIVKCEFNTTNSISELTDFSATYSIPTNTSIKYTFSWDDITYYKWNGVDTWVTESTPHNGNDYSVFVAGCQDGFTAPAGQQEAYIKIAMQSTDASVTPYVEKDTIKLEMSVITTDNNLYLASDDLIDIDFTSDTTTTITSKSDMDVALSVHLGILAPPYDEQYDE